MRASPSRRTTAAYYRRVLRPMRHPRTNKKLDWVRVVDFYHAAQRLWTMASALFGTDARAGAAWAKRMAKLLKKPNGPSRVLHSAAQLKARRTLSKTRENRERRHSTLGYLSPDEYERSHHPDTR